MNIISRFLRHLKYNNHDYLSSLLYDLLLIIFHIFIAGGLINLILKVKFTKLPAVCLAYVFFHLSQCICGQCDVTYVKVIEENGENIGKSSVKFEMRV